MELIQTTKHPVSIRRMVLPQHSGSKRRRPLPLSPSKNRSKVETLKRNATSKETGGKIKRAKRGYGGLNVVERLALDKKKKEDRARRNRLSALKSRKKRQSRLMLLEYEQVQLTTKVTELQKLNSQLEQRLQLKNYSHQNNKCQDNVTSNKEFETHQKKVNTDFSKNNLPTTLANDSARLLSGNLPKSLSNDDGIEKYAKSSYNTKKMCTQRQMQTCKFDRRHKQNDNRIQNSNRYENIKDKRRSKPGRLSTSPMTSDTYAVMVKAVEAKLCALKQRNDDVSRNANCAKKIKLLEKLHSEIVSKKKELRALKNKASAMRCRERKRRQLNKLTNTVEDLRASVISLEQQRASFQEKLSSLEQDMSPQPSSITAAAATTTAVTITTTSNSSSSSNSYSSQKAGFDVSINQKLHDAAVKSNTQSMMKNIENNIFNLNSGSKSELTHALATSLISAAKHNAQCISPTSHIASHCKQGREESITESRHSTILSMNCYNPTTLTFCQSQTSIPHNNCNNNVIGNYDNADAKMYNCRTRSNSSSSNSSLNSVNNYMTNQITHECTPNATVVRVPSTPPYYSEKCLTEMETPYSSIIPAVPMSTPKNISNSVPSQSVNLPEKARWQKQCPEKVSRTHFHTPQQQHYDDHHHQQRIASPAFCHHYVDHECRNYQRNDVITQGRSCVSNRSWIDTSNISGSANFHESVDPENKLVSEGTQLLLKLYVNLRPGI